MGAVLRASTKGIKAYHRVLKEVAHKGIEVQTYHIPEPEVQKIAIEASKTNARVDSLNR
jgi:ribosomal protein L19